MELSNRWQDDFNRGRRNCDRRPLGAALTKARSAVPHEDAGIGDEEIEARTWMKWSQLVVPCLILTRLQPGSPRLSFSKLAVHRSQYVTGQSLLALRAGYSYMARVPLQFFSSFFSALLVFYTTASAA